jgi:hypothetical protein
MCARVVRPLTLITYRYDSKSDAACSVLINDAEYIFDFGFVCIVVDIVYFIILCPLSVILILYDDVIM